MKTPDAIEGGPPSEILSNKSVELCAENDSWKLLCIPPLNFKVVAVQALVLLCAAFVFSLNTYYLEIMLYARAIFFPFRSYR